MFERISDDHQVMGSVACIRGTRIPWPRSSAWVTEGMTIDETLADFPQLIQDDIRDALRYAR